MKKSIKFYANLIGISVVFAITIGINVTAVSMKETLNQWASISSTSASDEDLKDLIENGKKLAEDIELEGSVLTQNKNNLLPLSKTTNNKVNVFGWSSTQWVQGGSGSGRVVSLKTDLLKALDNYGISTNDELENMYKDFLDNRPYFNNSQGTLNSYSHQYSVLYEPNINDTRFYKDSILENALDYSDTAFVVLSRVTGESNDNPRKQYYSNTKGGINKKTDETRNYQDISKDEEELLEYVASNYENTVVIVNSPIYLNLEFLKRIDKIDSCLLVGGTGEDAANAIPKLLYGEYSPSGRLTDTYPYDLKSLPHYYDASADEGGKWGRYTNGKGLYPADGTNYGNVGDSNARYDGVSYVDYSEDIYIGYKWYETANQEGFFDNVNNEYGKGYDGVVQYPFGYGLSYTSFKKEITALSHVKGSNLNLEDELEITISVENTGDVKGSEAVQLYLTKPYYKNGIEKSHVELLDFNKTLVLEPSKKETVVFKIPVSNFASYDDYDKNSNGFKGYEIEKGEYLIKLMDNSHTLVSNDSFVTYNISKDILVDKDPITGLKVENKFLETSSDGVAIDGSDSEQNITYLTRSNFKGTFNEEPVKNRAMSKSLKDNNLYTTKMANDFINEEDEEIITNESNNLKVYENEEITELGLKLGKNFNDPEWDKTLNQLRLDELTKSSLHGYVHNEAIASIGKPKTTEVDGPSQIGSFNVAKSGVGYPNSTVLAQTFSRGLAYKFGKQVAKEANYCGYDGWYAPGVNLHRSPFGGRNYEYYSEDPYMSGLLGAYVIKGSINIGVYVYLKHLIVYEQESYRDGLYTWLTEQNVRENYLRPFKMAIQIGGCSGIMTSYNRLGATWAGGNIDLITGVLKNEWDYKGAIITDYSDHHKFMIMDQAIRAGGTLYMDGYLNNGEYKYETTSNTFKKCLREAAKRNIYTFLNGKYQSKVFLDSGEDPFAPVHKGETIYYWTYILMGIDIVAVAGLGIWTYLALIKKKKVKNGQE